jgi:peptidoglycan/xylan/chitin deacetylase (PgdA/CDA1 family)
MSAAGANGRVERQMDNPYYAWSPISTRPRLSWPDEAPVALCVLLSLEHLEWFPPRGSFIPPSSVGYGPYPELFQLTGVSKYEYGNRVGVFRVLEILDRLGIRATVAIDSALAAANPFLAEACVSRGCEIVAHGRAYSRMITAEMAEDDERAYIRSTLDELEQATGRRAAGWVGADYGESPATVRLLAELGLRYVSDWANDEQPYPMSVPTGEITALPVAIDLDDVFTHRIRHVAIERWSRMVVEAYARLEADGRANGRVLVLHVHPWLIGQPFRIRYLDEALTAIVERGSAWVATGSEIIDWYTAQRLGEPA